MLVLHGADDPLIPPEQVKVIQIADTFGVYGLSFMAAASNVAFVAVLLAWQRDGVSVRELVRSVEEPRPEPLLAAAGSILLAEIAFARLWRRRLP